MGPYFRPQDLPALDDVSDQVTIPAGSFYDVVKVFRTLGDFMIYTGAWYRALPLRNIDSLLIGEGKVGIVFVASDYDAARVPKSPRLQTWVVSGKPWAQREEAIDEVLRRLIEVYNTPLVPLDPFAVQLMPNNEFLMTHPDLIWGTNDQ